MSGDITRTERGNLLRQIADATDKAEALLNLEIDSDSVAIKLGMPIGNAFTDLLTEGLRANFDAVRAYAQAKLNDDVERLTMRYGQMMDDAAPAAAQPPRRRR